VAAPASNAGDVLSWKTYGGRKLLKTKQVDKIKATLHEEPCTGTTLLRVRIEQRPTTRKQYTSCLPSAAPGYGGSAPCRFQRFTCSVGSAFKLYTCISSYMCGYAVPTFVARSSPNVLSIPMLSNILEVLQL